MTLKQSFIYIDNIRLHARHGVAPQENTVGADFTISVRIGYNLEKAGLTDDVADTISYAEVFECVKREMAIPSKLLEHAARRVADSIAERFDGIESIDIKLTKDNPPMGAESDGAGVELHFE